MSRHVLFPPEPLGDRPAAWSVTGDVWQRSGPPGTPTWTCALPPWPLRGLTWLELCALCEGEVTVIERPPMPDLAYTTDSIPVVRDAGVSWAVTS